MSFKRAAKRKKMSKLTAAEKKERRNERAARQSVKRAYVYEHIKDTLTRKEALHNLSACFLLAMHRGYGFGRGRLMKLRDKMQSEFDAIVSKNVSIEEITMFLQNEIGLDVDIAARDTKADRQRQIEFKAVQQMSAAFLMALLDEFGFKKKRLANAYWQVCDLSDKVSHGEIKYDEICAKVQTIMEAKAA